MIDSFLARVALGAGLVAAGFIGGIALASPAWAASAVPTTGCYAGPEGNDQFAFGKNACAAPTGSGGGERWDTRGFIGISVPLGEDFNPHLAVGLRHTNVNGSNVVYGGEINASISLITGLEDAQFRLLAIAGKADALGIGLLGNAGIGWDTRANSVLLNAGLQVPYARFFVDYTIDDSSLRAFFEANSYGKIEAVQSTVSCGPGTVVADGAEILQKWANAVTPMSVTGDIFNGFFDFFGTGTFSGTPSAAFVDGKTCYTQGKPRAVI